MPHHPSFVSQGASRAAPGPRSSRGSSKTGSEASSILTQYVRLAAQSWASRVAADPGEGEESLWLLQGKREDAGYDDVELSALGTSPVTFS